MLDNQKDIKKMMYDALFGGSGSLTMAQFRAALTTIVDSFVAFKKEMVSKIAEIDSVVRNVQDGHTPTDKELLDLIKPLIPKVEDGHTPTKEELLALVRPLIPKVKDGLTPSDAKLLKLIKSVLPEQLPADTGEEMIVKINNDKSDRLIRRGKVEGLEEIENMARTADANSRSFINTGSYVYDYELFSQLNGVLKTFTLPANAKIVMVFGTSTPIIFSKNTDYTYTASTITFTSQVDAGTTLAAGQNVIILYKIL